MARSKSAARQDKLTAISERLEEVQHAVFAAAEIVLGESSKNKLLFSAHCTLSLAEKEIERIATDLSTPAGGLR